ncbi:pentapeptide repeat-containing protein [Hypericibacter sp.]|uniref:pentapeptide repeat-containing protein n=1 Tax=Hypericibacter sp. TaxID=2705401 RepID=UPI003D6D13E3
MNAARKLRPRKAAGRTRGAKRAVVSSGGMAPPVIQPNMLVANADMASSTLTRVRHDHSVISETRYLNCLFSESNFEGSSFQGCGFDGCVVENASLRGVELRNCDVEGLVIDGINVGELLKQLTGR